MKDMVIDACQWYVDDDCADQVKKKAVEEFRNRYTPLLHFLEEAGLVKNKITDAERNWLEFELKMSDLTDEGLELLMLCHDKWLDSIARGSNPGNISLWQRQLNKLRDEDPMLLH